MNNKGQSYIFIGRSGCGKGTQAKELIKTLQAKDPTFSFIHVETGAEFRKYVNEPAFTAALTKKTIDFGNLMPEFMCIFMWSRLFHDKFTGKETLIFDGTPRKLLETKVLQELFPFYGMDKPWVIYLDVDHEEATQRLKIRGRNDDTDESIAKRQEWYQSDVYPSVEYYRTNPNVRFVDINGKQSIEKVHADIVEKVGLV